MDRSKQNLINCRLLVYILFLSIFESDIVLSFSVLTFGNRNSNDQHVLKLNIFLFM